MLNLTRGEPRPPPESGRRGAQRCHRLSPRAPGPAGRGTRGGSPPAASPTDRRGPALGPALRPPGAPGWGPAAAGKGIRGPRPALAAPAPRPAAPPPAAPRPAFVCLLGAGGCSMAARVRKEGPGGRRRRGGGQSAGAPAGRARRATAGNSRNSDQLSRNSAADPPPAGRTRLLPARPPLGRRPWPGRVGRAGRGRVGGAGHGPGMEWAGPAAASAVGGAGRWGRGAGRGRPWCRSGGKKPEWKGRGG